MYRQRSSGALLPSRRDFLRLMGGGISLVAVGGVASACGTGASNEGQQSVELRYAHPGTPGSIQGRFADNFSEMIADRTDERVRIDVYPASQLGGVEEMLQGTESGSIDMGHNDFAAVAQLYEDLAVFNTPYLYRDTAHLMAATSPETSPLLQRMSENLISESNVQILGSFFYGPRHLTANSAVYEPADLRGEDIRAIPLPIWIATVGGMGATPTSVDFDELPTNLQTGVVDGQENPLSTIYDSSFYESQSHMMLTKHMMNTLAVYINNDSWNQLSEEDQQIMQDTLDDLRTESVQWGLENELQLISDLEDEGMTVIREEDGLDLAAFSESVSENVRGEFPEWEEYWEEILAIEPEETFPEWDEHYDIEVGSVY